MTGAFVTPSYMVGATQTISTELLTNNDPSWFWNEIQESMSTDPAVQARRRASYERNTAEREAANAALIREHRGRIATYPDGPLRDVLELHAPQGSTWDFGCDECGDSEYGNAEFPCRTYCTAAGIA